MFLSAMHRRSCLFNRPHLGVDKTVFAFHIHVFIMHDFCQVSCVGLYVICVDSCACIFDGAFPRVISLGRIG